MENIQEIYLYTMELLERMSIKHTSWHFSSGAIMVDIWHNNKFYVIQFENYIGVSEVDNNVGLDTTPDEKFFNEIEFKIKLNNILERGSNPYKN